MVKLCKLGHVIKNRECGTCGAMRRKAYERRAYAEDRAWLDSGTYPGVVQELARKAWLVWL